MNSFVFSHLRDVSLIAIILLLIITSFVPMGRRHIISKICGFLAFADIVLHYIFFNQYLPLHLCNLMEILAVITFYTRWQRGYECLLFLGMSGALASIVSGFVPVDRNDTFIYLYMGGHIFLVFAPLFLTFHLGMRPRTHAWWKVVAFFVPVLVAVWTYDFFFDAFYMRVKNMEGKAASGIFLPWPYYGIQLILGGGFLSFLISRVFRAVPEKTESKRPSVFILTLSAGGGHLEAAKVKLAEIKEKYPEAEIIQKDRIPNQKKDWWARAQKTGNTTLLHYIYIAGYLLPQFDFLFSMIRILKKENIFLVIDTQTLSTKQTIRAIRYINWWYHKNISYEKVLTELPTKYTNNYFRSLRSLSSKDRKQIKLCTTLPLLEEGETEELFWKTHTKLSLQSISYGPLPVRPSFQVSPLTAKSESLTILLPDLKERELVIRGACLGNRVFNKNAEEIHLVLQKNEKVSLMMMGSVPQEEAILQYIEQFIVVSREKNYTNRKDLLFVLCGSCTDFVERIITFLEQQKNYPSSLTIFALPYQKDTVIAPLLHRADLSISRSGGLTSMELLLASKGQIFIHKEDKKRPMPIWEWGNYTYLKEKKGASLITPKTFKESSNLFFQEGF